MPSAKTETAGLEPRLEAAARLSTVLRGAPFVPFTPSEIADGRDRALANRLVTTALRRTGHIEHILSHTLTKGVPSRSGLLEAILRIGVAQLLFMEEVPAHSALHLAVESARTDRRARRFDKLVNGVLRAVQREAADLSALPAPDLFPAWLRTQWAAQYGSDAVAAFATALLAGAPLDLTFKQGPSPRSELETARVLAASYRLITREAAVADLPGFAQGDFWVQDAAAAIPARLVRAAPGMRVLDMCAAPGGKTAQLCADGAQVTALELDPDRMKRLQDNLARLSLSAEMVVGDALAVRFDDPFDAVLVDAPCSATGTFRRHPDVVWQRTATDVAQRQALQRAFIERAHEALKPGGTLVYCVCSLEAAEGEDQVRWIAEQVPDLEPDPVAVEELEGWANPVTAAGTVRTTPALAVPGAAGGTLDGFFIARFRKRT